MSFTYDEFATRNLGFVTAEEQNLLRRARIFAPGVGGMGGTAVACLARSGIENFHISDPDTFEVSNLNRQIFSKVDRVGHNKAEAARADLLQINPGILIEIWDAGWPDKLDTILPQVDVVLNGCDDTRASILLMRKAQEYGKTVVDAFASTLPNVFVVTPQSPRPELAFGYPTLNVTPEAWTEDMLKACTRRELEYVLTHSSSRDHTVFEYAVEVATGKRKRISQAPMVWMTGLLMAYEVIKVILRREHLCDHRGIFLNPWTFRYEKPLNPVVASVKSRLVRRLLQKL